jgi:hypothetical protein
MSEINANLKYMIRLECDWQTAQAWCMSNVGDFDVDWYRLGIDPAASLFGDKTTTWYFKDEKTMTLFALKFAK